MRLTLPPPGVEAVLLAVVLGAAVYDVRYRRIPNWLTVGGVLIGVVLNTFLFQGWPAGLRFSTFLVDAWPGMRFSLMGLAIGFGVYFVLYVLRAMGAGDVKLMAAIGSLVGWQDWFGIFIVTAIVGGIMSIILVTVRGRVKKTLWNVGFIMSEMKSGRPGYVGKEELDVKHPKAMGLPHGAVIAVGTIFFLALSARLSQ
ncbi:MAG TPA: A24 family peptidase [Bryobacteraceae bacterium]|nr:A24 family peptidase [Bryobacteraceae bacterium]